MPRHQLFPFMNARYRVARVADNAVQVAAPCDIDTQLYAVQDISTGMFFSWCYRNEDFAAAIARKLSDINVDGMNYVGYLDSTVLSDRTSFG